MSRPPNWSAQSPAWLGALRGETGSDAIIGAMGNRSAIEATQAPVVAIDGPVASGKSSVGRAAATRLGLRFLDTGLMYRAVTWLALKVGEDVADADAMGLLAKGCDMSLTGDCSANLITVNGQRLSADDLTSDDVDRNVSAVAASASVRRALVAQQRSIAKGGGIVMAGRDIGSVVLTDADVKLYIDASPEDRARRRFLQQKEQGSDANYEQALADTIRRDELDSQRADSPLTVPRDAIVINTDHLDLSQTVDAVVHAISTATAAGISPAATPR